MPFKTKEEKRLYDIEYRKKNVDKIKDRTVANRPAKRLADKKYADKNKEKKQTYDKIYRESNRIEKQVRDKKYYESNKDRVLTQTKIYRQSNKELINSQIRKRKETDPLYKLTCNLRSALGQIFRQNGYKKPSKTEQILGCSFGFFKEYIESKFEPWMTWDNRGLYNGEINHGWDIDHITPLSSVSSVDDIIQLNHYTNLQPLCSKINRDIKRNII